MELPGNSEFTSDFFDQSSQSWLQNKIRHGAAYSYKCLYIHSNKKQCHHAATHNDYCKRHHILLKSQQKRI